MLQKHNSKEPFNVVSNLPLATEPFLLAPFPEDTSTDTVTGDICGRADTAAF